MKFVVDMNLTPEWCEALTAEGWDAVHWYTVGPATALDEGILTWALTEGRIVLTQDLDFGAILAATNANAPSVVLLRTHDSLPESIGLQVISVLHRYQLSLESGSLLIIDDGKSRIRILPLRGDLTTRLSPDLPT